MSELLPVAPLYRLVAFFGALYYSGNVVDLLGCPALVGEIVAGMLLGPDVADLLPPTVVDALKIAGQAGLCLMVIEGGISMESDVLKQKGVRAVVLAATGTVLPVLLGWLTMLSLGHSSTCALASGIALSSTAIGFTMRMMTDMKLLETAEGQLITAAAMIDDVFSLILLSMLTVVQDAALAEQQSGEQQTQQSTSSAWTIVRPLLASAVVTLVGLVCFHVVESPSFASFGKLLDRSSPDRLRSAWQNNEQELMVLFLIGGGMLAAWLSDGLYSTLLLGAFTVGAVCCTRPLAREAWSSLVAPLQSWLARCFFGATVGFQVPVRDLFEGGNIGPGLLLTVAAVLGKWLSGAWGTSICQPAHIDEMADGHTACSFANRVYWGTFNRVGCAMIGRGELGFQLATTARSAGILTPPAYSATIWALLLATLLGPVAFRLSMRFTACGLENEEGKTAVERA